MATTEAKKDNLLANCGGTASQERRTDLLLERLRAEDMIARLHPDVVRGRTIDGYDLWPALNSSDVNAREHLQILAERIVEWRHDYRSITIVVGTNSAVYIGSYLSYALGRGLDVPITLVSGQRHQGRMGSDSMKNIENTSRGTMEAADLGVREVMLYSGERGMSFLRAVGAEKASDNSFLIYQSPNIPPVAELTAHETRFSRLARYGKPPEHFRLRNFTMEGIIPVNVHPDFDPNFIEAVANIDGCRAIVLEAYETGNLPNNLLKPIGRVIKQGVNVVVVPSFNEPNLTYKMPKEEQNAVMAGAVAAPGNVTKSALITKIGFWLTYGKNDLKGIGLGEFLDTDYVGEIPDSDDLVRPTKSI